MAVLRPLKVVIENYPEDQVEELEFPNHPDYPEMGTRTVPFGRTVYLEQGDFMEEPFRKFYRLAPGREVRLRWAYLITCTDVIKDEAGEIVELRCTYDPATKGGNTPDGRKVKGTLHWVSAAHAVDAEVRLYDRLYTVENPNDPEPGKDFVDYLNPGAMEVLRGCKLEPSLDGADAATPVQFERNGYFVADRKDSAPGALVFNRAVALRDTWAKLAKQQQAQQQQKQKQKHQHHKGQKNQPKES
jgi:glutaminyl-tRNA synthetase